MWEAVVVVSCVVLAVAMAAIAPKVWWWSLKRRGIAQPLSAAEFRRLAVSAVRGTRYLFSNPWLPARIWIGESTVFYAHEDDAEVERFIGLQKDTLRLLGDCALAEKVIAVHARSLTPTQRVLVGLKIEEE